MVLCIIDCEFVCVKVDLFCSQEMVVILSNILILEIILS